MPFSSFVDLSVPGSSRTDGRTHRVPFGRLVFVFLNRFRSVVPISLNSYRTAQTSRPKVVPQKIVEDAREKTVVMGKIIFLFLAVGIVRGQLNYEGNPLTENTEYTAEETHFSSRTARKEETARNLSNHLTERPQRLYPVVTKKNLNDTEESRAADYDKKIAEPITVPVVRSDSIRVESSRQLAKHSYDRVVEPASQAELALSSFLNSKTPEESRLSLEHYLQSSDSSKDHRSGNVPPRDQAVLQEPSSISMIDQQRYSFQQELQQPQEPTNQMTHQRTLSTVPRVNEPQVIQQQQILRSYSPANPTHPLHRFVQSSVPTYNLPATNVPNSGQTLSNVMTTHVGGLQQQVLQPVPFAPGIQSDIQAGISAGIQARNDVYYPGWRTRRIRGKPYHLAQPRIGAGLFKGPGGGPFKSKGPVEIIYTRPPGFHRGQPPIGKPPLQYEDASAWFPDAEYPPPSKDVYYSQLYAQSYDPYYYNYIAKTGKIKPHLYGKLGKPDDGGGMWAELFRGFKKHGLKNIMTPGFFLGMTLPVVTLMLSALVQKRSFARSDSRGFSQEDGMQEYLEKLQRAMECYERKRRRSEDANVDDC